MPRGPATASDRAKGAPQQPRARAASGESQQQQQQQHQRSSSRQPVAVAGSDDDADDAEEETGNVEDDQQADDDAPEEDESPEAEEGEEQTLDEDEEGDEEEQEQDDGEDDDEHAEDAEDEHAEADEGEGEEDSEPLPASSKSPHALTLDAATSAAYTAAMAARGVIYISRIPPYMKAAKLRFLLEKLIPATRKHGRIGRIFLTPEDASLARKRKRAGGNTGKKFVDGWVEFESKKVARWLAETFNTQPMGGPKRSRYVEDLWTLKYLPGFKWSHLTEKIAYEKQIRGTKIREEMSQAKRDSEYYQSQVEKDAKKRAADERRDKQGDKKRKREGDGESERNSAPKAQRLFHQRSLIDQKPSASKAAAAAAAAAAK